jgi:DNA gyrase subunit A
MVCVENENEDILVVSENGYGKRSKIEDYRLTNRGGKGVKTINITEKTGQLISIKSVDDSSDLMIITQSGLTIRMSVSLLRIMGRTAQGVRLINLKEGDQIASITIVPSSEEPDEIIGLPNGSVELPENEDIQEDTNNQPEE